jgi:hypothetical protein
VRRALGSAQGTQGRGASLGCTGAKQAAERDGIGGMGEWGMVTVMYSIVKKRNVENWRRQG